MVSQGWHWVGGICSDIVFTKNYALARAASNSGRLPDEMGSRHFSIVRRI